MKQKLKILHLEDLPTDAEMVERELEKGGIEFESLIVSNKKEYTQALKDFTPDLILSDHSLPMFDSREAFHILKASGSTVPFILITSTISEEYAVEIMKDGAYDYILKDRLQRLPKAIMNAMEKWRAEDAKNKTTLELKAAHEKLLFHIENTPLGFIEWDNQLHVKSLSKRAEEIFGWSLKEFMDSGRDAYTQVYEEDLPRVNKMGSQLLSGEITRSRILHRNYTKNAGVIWCEWFNTVMKDEDGNVSTIMSLVQDVTERIKADEELLESQKVLRQLTAHLETIREEERTSIAREIHDELGQQLTGLKMDVAWIKKKIIVDDPLLNERLKGMISLIDETVKTVRKISSDLRPGVLDDLGLIAALDWQSQEFEERLGIPCSFKAELSDQPFEKSIATGIFRIFQESLTNVARHSGATQVYCNMECIKGNIVLVIADNGKGFNEKHAKSKKTLGVIGMKERALMMGGTFKIESAAPSGTKIILSVPFKEQQQV